jgi:hypothetical protein
MAQSPEYPALKWVPPKSWTNANRTYIQFVTIHDTEGSSHAQSAEDGAAYDARRTDGTSAHYFVDNTSIVQCVRTEDQAHTARTQGNRRGIHYELCARASWAKAKWLDPSYGLPMLRIAAAQVAKDCKKWSIPIRKITASQAAAGTKGILGHADITKAFPQDKGSHTDPGSSFPWAEFIAMVQTAADPPLKSVGEWLQMASKEDLKAAVREVLTEVHRFPGGIGDRLHKPKTEGGPGWNPMADRTVLAYLFEHSLNISAAFRAFVEYEKADDADREDALDRLEAATARIEAAVVPPPSDV